MDVKIRTPALSMQADAYVIKNPYETKNAHTITKASDAASVLNLTSESEIEALKELIRGCDFTSISTSQLSRVGSRLSELELMGTGKLLLIEHRTWFQNTVCLR